MSEAIKCKECGKYFDGDFNVCPYCGNIAEIEETDITIPIENEPTAENTTPEIQDVKYCIKCGVEMPMGTNFCTNCGSKVDIETPISYQEEIQNPAITSVKPIVQHPMKWFKFLIYFALFLGAFINFVYGVNYISGGIYSAQTNGEITSDIIYGIYGSGLKTLDVIYGIVMLAMAGFGIYTRFRLSKYKVNAPICVYILSAIGTALSLFYNIALFIITGLNEVFSATVVTSIIGSAIYILLNYKYFSKRKALFINQ